MGTPFYDANNHLSPAPGTTLAGGAVGVVTAGSISGTTAAGAAPTVAIPSGFSCNDSRGTFDLTAVTGGGAQAAGDVATVRFAKEYTARPGAVIVTLYDDDTTDLARTVCATALTTAGFNINVPAVLVTAHVYRISYVVIP
jgi:hypothetical protein